MKRINMNSLKRIFDTKLLTTATYAKTKARWQLVAAHSSRVGEQ